MRNWYRLVAAFCLLCFIAPVMTPLTAEPTVTIDSYTQDHIPDWAKDLRRTEIITLGSLPFTTLAAKIGYTFWRYYANDFSSDYMPNPLAKSSEGARLNSEEQKMVLKIAVASSIVFGLSDLAITLYNRWQDAEDEKEQQLKLEETVTITPLGLKTEGEIE